MWLACQKREGQGDGVGLVWSAVGRGGGALSPPPLRSRSRSRVRASRFGPCALQDGAPRCSWHTYALTLCTYHDSRALHCSSHTHARMLCIYHDSITCPTATVWEHLVDRREHPGRHADGDLPRRGGRRISGGTRQCEWPEEAPRGRALRVCARAPVLTLLRACSAWRERRVCLCSCAYARVPMHVHLCRAGAPR